MQRQLDNAHHIQQLFMYQYKNQWVSQSFINRHNRLWIKTFNDLVSQGFIEKKKTMDGWKYRWKARFP